MNTAPTGRFRWLVPPQVLGFVWLFGCSLIDWLTGPELSIAAFYLPGVVLVAWFSNRSLAILAAIVGSAAWLIPELMSHKQYSHYYIPYWNAAIRLSFFLITVLLITEVKSRQRVEVALKTREIILQSILDSMADAVVVVDDDGMVIVFNDAAMKIFGSSAIGRDAVHWASEVDSSLKAGMTSVGGATGPFQRALTRGQSGTWEISRRKEGSGDVQYLGLATQPVVGKICAGGSVVLVVADLTERRLVEMQISEATEREQSRIGRDLHDGVCQHLVSVAFAAGTLQRRLNSLGHIPEAAAAGDIAALTNEAITEARDLAHGLYPAALADSIEVALQSLARTTGEMTQIRCISRIGGDMLQIDPVAAVHLYRIAQEAVSNASRHAAPNTIWISLDNHGKLISLTIEDDGKGLGESPFPLRGIGLNIMRQRSLIIGGILEIDSSSDGGTRIVCIVPISNLPAPLP